jgi:DNA-binding beta-propeller fold protein YncE
VLKPRSPLPEAGAVARIAASVYNSRFVQSLNPRILPGVLMSFRHKVWLTATIFATMICLSCGQIYRPVVIPVSNTPPTPGNFHAVFSLNTNAYYGLVPDPNNPGQVIPSLVYGPGSGMQVDVSGDTDLGVASLVNGTLSGANPTHAVSLPNNSRVFVAAAGSVLANGVDTIASFAPASGSSGSSGIGTTSVVSLPNFVPGSFCPYLPDFVAASQNTTVYVANYGVENAPSACNPNSTPPTPTSTDSIAVVNASTNTVSNIVYLPAGSHPVAMAQVQTPSGNKLYVANQGTNSVASFNTVDMSTNPVTGFTGTTPEWMVARSDGQLLYVLSQGDGQLWTFNTTSDTVIGNVSVGAGANYILYDPNLNRLYVTNPNNSSVYVFSVAGNLPSLLNTIVLGSGSPGNYPACANNPCPTSVAALPDGTRAYIASYQLGSGCTDPNFTTPISLTSIPVCFVSASVTVIDALTTTIKSTISAFPSATASVPEVANCVPVNGILGYGPYFPGLVPVLPAPASGPVSRFASRFRVSAAAAADSSRVYVSVCDAGSVAIINTTDSNTNNPGSNLPADTLVLDLPTPFGIGTTSNASPQQNPIFLLPGR